jgi:hypothetical protein
MNGWPAPRLHLIVASGPAHLHVPPKAAITSTDLRSPRRTPDPEAHRVPAAWRAWRPDACPGADGRGRLLTAVHEVHFAAQGRTPARR